MSSLNIKDPILLTAALEGLELQKNRIDEQIAEIRGMLGRNTGKKAVGASDAPAPAKRGRKRKLSAAARARIAAAQKKRWAEYRKSKSDKG